MVELLIALASVSSIVAKNLPDIVDELHQKNRLTDDEKALVLAQHEALMNSHAAKTDEELTAESNAVSPDPRNGASE